MFCFFSFFFLQLQKGCRSARLHSAAVCPFCCVHALARSVKMCSRALCPRQTGDTNTGLSRLSLTIIAGTSPRP
uniref:Putative secreted protein n=1 Tax=Rhipicephalus microplus TaxID=6941 RepID=A0A6M2DBD3_RHIMP